MTPDFPPGTRVRVMLPPGDGDGPTGTVRAEDEGFDNPGMAYVELDDGQAGLFWPEMLGRADEATGDSSQAEATVRDAEVKAAFPQAVATIESYLLARRQGGMSIDSTFDAITLNGAATVELADILEKMEISNLNLRTALRGERDELERVRERLEKAEAPPY